MCDLSFSNVSFTYVGALVFGTFMFSTGISSWWIFLVTNMKCPFLCLLIDLSLKSILLDIRLAIPACFLGLFDWKIFFPTLYSEVMSVSEVEVCFLYAAEGWILFSYSVC